MKRKNKAVSYQTAALMRAKQDKYFKMIALIGFLFLWEVFGRVNLHTLWIEPKFLPMPSEIILAAVTYIQAGTFWGHVGISLYRVFIGFLIGVVLAVIIGGGIASFRFVDNIISPILNLFGPIPIMAFLPMFVLWFGIGESSKIILVTYATIIYMVSYVSSGIKNTDSVLIRSASSLGAGPVQIFFKVKFQSALPHIFEGMKGALGAAFGAMVVAEMMGASTGLGYIIVFSKNWFKMSDMFMAAIVIGLLYSLIFAVLSLIESRLFRWKTSGANSAVES
ncbi:MAG: ABC transporter permease [Lachnospiraceae bacterium]|nr:ABC transporter permease [Lachnospiraceae bacterium]